MSFDLLYAIEVVKFYARRAFSLHGIANAIRPECDDADQ